MENIGVVAGRLGLRPSALRFYETAGILPPARRVGGYRVYSEEDVAAIEVALFARSVGFTLAEVKQLFSESPRRPALDRQWRPLALAKLQELDGVIRNARKMREAIASGLECGCIRITDCVPARPKKRTNL